MVHPAVIAAIIGAAVVAGVVTYYYIDEHYNQEYDFVGATRRPRYHTVSDSDTDDEDQGFNPRSFLKRAGLRRRRRNQGDDRHNETFGMVDLDEKLDGSSNNFESKLHNSESEERNPFADDGQSKLRQERLRNRGNSVLGIMPLESQEQVVQEAEARHVDDPFGDSHEASKPETSGFDGVNESNVANLAASAPRSNTSSHYGSVQENITPYGSIHSSIHDGSSQSPIMRPVSPRQDPSTETWRFEDNSFIEANEEDEELEYENVKNSLQIPGARGHRSATVSSSSSWSDIDPQSQARSDVSDSDISIIGKDKSSHDSHSTSEDEDGYIDIRSHESKSS